MIKKIFKVLIVFTLLLSGWISWKIYSTVGWTNFSSTMKNFVQGKVLPKDNSDNDVIQNDTIISAGYTIVDKCQDPNLLSNGNEKLHYYFKEPFTKQNKKLETEKYSNNSLKEVIRRPSDDNAQQAFIMYSKGNITDFVERGLQIKLGKCYENNFESSEENYRITCNVIFVSPNKEDLVKTISVFSNNTYDFYYNDGHLWKWNVTGPTMDIPFDYSFYGKNIQFLNEAGITIN